MIAWIFNRRDGTDLSAHHLRFGFIFIAESLLVSAIAGTILFVAGRTIRSIKGAGILLLFFLLPVYAVYNYFSTLRAIHKSDIEFYSGEILEKNDKGYFIKGVNGYRFGFIKKLGADNEPNVGDRVILARFRNEFSLISDYVSML